MDSSVGISSWALLYYEYDLGKRPADPPSGRKGIPAHVPKFVLGSFFDIPKWTLVYYE